MEKTAYMYEGNNIQYAGYPLSDCIETGIKTGGYQDIGISRFEGLTIPLGLYSYKYSHEIHETPTQHIDIEVIEEPRYQRLLQQVSIKNPKNKSAKSKPNKKTNTKKRA